MFKFDDDNVFEITDALNLQMEILSLFGEQLYFVQIIVTCRVIRGRKYLDLATQSVCI